MERNKTNDLQNYIKIKSKTTKDLKKAGPYLISYKSFLEILLAQVKNYQAQCLSLNPNQNPKKIKGYLIKIKASLSSIYKEKIIKQKFLENRMSIKKLKLQNLLYDKKPKKDIKENQHYHYNSVNNLNYHNDKNNIIELDNKNIINYLNEKQQLEILIFQLQNEIEKIDFEIQKKINLILNLRAYRLNQEENLEIITEQKNLKSKAGRILKKNLKNCQQKLLEALNHKIKNDLKARKIKEEIENLKKEIKCQKEYIESDNIIFEESSDYARSIVIDSEIININNEEDNNNNDINKPKNMNKINNNGDKKNKGNRHSVGFLSIMDDKFHLNNNINKCNMNLNGINDQLNSKMIRSISNKIKRINLNQFKNNCKLNINFNFNVNNLNIINGKLNEEQIIIGKEKILTSNNNKFNKQNTFEKKSNNKIKYEYNSDNEDNKNRTKNISFDNNSSLII